MKQGDNNHTPVRDSDDEVESFHISDTRENITGYEEEEGYSRE